MEPIRAVLDDSSGDTIGLPDELTRLYGGALRLPTDVVYANFVSTIDGVAAIPSAERSSTLISGGADPDRFVMGLLRACADVVLIGAGTLRTHPRSRWTPGTAYEPAAAAFAEARERRGAPGNPPLAIVSASGEFDPNHPGLADGALLLTTSGIARTKTFPPRVEVVDLGERVPVHGESIVTALRARGFRRILTEGGPGLMGTLIEAGVVNEIFLTVSPQLAGRSPKQHRPGIVDELEILPDGHIGTVLGSVRTAGSYLFLRYTVA